MNNLNNDTPVENDVVSEKSGRSSDQHNTAITLGDLFHIIFKKLHPIYSIDCGTLLLYDENITLIRQAFVAEHDPATREMHTERIDDALRLESIQAEIAGFDFPVLKTKSEWEADYDFNHTLPNSDTVYNFHCYIPLEKDNRILGTLELHNREKALSTEGLTFCSNIADLLADIVMEMLDKVDDDWSLPTITVSDGADNSDFMSGDFQALMALSNAIRDVRTPEDLRKVISKQFRSFSFICDLVIATVQADRNTYTIFTLDNEGQISDPFSANASYLLTDRIFSQVSASVEPVLIRLGEISASQDLPGYAIPWTDNAAREIAGMTLVNRGELIGALFLRMRDEKQFLPHQLLMVKAVSCQIAVAVANMRAYEEIIRKEDDKSKLLALSAEFSAARKKEDIDRIVRTNLRSLFDFEHFSIRLISPAQTTHDIYISSISDMEAPKNPELMRSGSFSTEDKLFDAIKAAAEPVMINLDELSKDEVPDYIRFWQLNGIARIIAVRLRHGNDMAGALLIYLTDHSIQPPLRLALLQGVADQLSFALNNVLAHEEINRQLMEINTYKQRLEDEKVFLLDEVQTNIGYSDIIGQGPEMQVVFQLLSQVSGTDSTVLILGETGTGKELIARAIHNDSERRDKTMIKINCAAIPPNLIESELFGHEKGSFTGATERRIGKFELANNSTIFLDEIGELPAELQVKLLRVLQEKELERVGGTSTIKTNVRVVAATNRDLRSEVEAGRFRRDLYYRLNVFPLNLPPLRSRQEDIPLLANYFLERYARKTGKKITGFSQRALNQIKSYHWPGNVRELEHLIERQVLLTKAPVIREIDIPVGEKPVVVSNSELITVKTIDENERDHIFEVLKLCNGKISGAGGAAKLLGVPATTLNSKIKRLGLTKTHLY